MSGYRKIGGTVNNLKAKERATRNAELVKGVRSVSNRIQVLPPKDLSDAEIKDRVFQALLQDPATDSYKIGMAIINLKYAQIKSTFKKKIGVVRETANTALHCLR
jgi:hypothetical protein